MLGRLEDDGRDVLACGKPEFPMCERRLSRLAESSNPSSTTESAFARLRNRSSFDENVWSWPSSFLVFLLPSQLLPFIRRVESWSSSSSKRPYLYRPAIVGSVLSSVKDLDRATRALEGLESESSFAARYVCLTIVSMLGEVIGRWDRGGGATLGSNEGEFRQGESAL